ncbi:MAG TPA: dTDP-glucose 4,6-dehydratase [bacterium]|nr:dTDP-glucose 4,6-dehydratase [bacterium]
MRTPKNILVTGGCGFIGSNFIRYLLARKDFTGRIVNLDALTYAGNPQSLADLAETHPDRYRFVHGDICDEAVVKRTFDEHAVDTVVHFAAESHVDRSISGPAAFIRTNLVGTFTLLEAARAAWKTRTDVLFHHISTDEVYGSLGPTGRFLETTAYDPRSPYSASKAGSDHLVSAYHHTYGLPVTISNCSNNFGPYQFPEKLIPLMILNLGEGKPLPVYGDGGNVRDWLHVADHCAAIGEIIARGRAGETYNIGGNNEWKNIDIVHLLCDILAEQTGKRKEEYTKLITFVADRPGHDRRYAIDCGKIERELGWRPTPDFRALLTATVRWYLDNPAWIASVRTGEYRRWLDTHYGAR